MIRNERTQNKHIWKCKWLYNLITIFPYKMYNNFLVIILNNWYYDWCLDIFNCIPYLRYASNTRYINKNATLFYPNYQIGSCYNHTCFRTVPGIKKFVGSIRQGSFSFFLFLYFRPFVTTSYKLHAYVPTVTFSFKSILNAQW